MKKKKLPKIFVLDTNVILHDFRAIHNFQENDIVIPIAVIEELDKFKKGNDTLSFNAREFVREMDKITDNQLFDNGIPIGKNKGIVKIELGHPFSEKMAESLFEDTQDHRILASTEWLTEKNPDRTVVLVTKDINLRMKAKALHLLAQDYLTDKITEERVENIMKEVIHLDNVSEDIMQKLFYINDGVPASELKLKNIPANQLYIITGEKKESRVLARYNSSTRSIIPVRKQKAYGIESRNDEQTFAIDALLNPDIKLISLTGTAGTGKTLLALAAAMAQEQSFDQVLLSRPVIPLKNQEMGFLPGDVKEKLGPYMLPLFDNLAVIKRTFKSTSREAVRVEEMLKNEKLLISPLAYIRGRSLSNTFFIIDEAQNLTPHEVKTIITRAGEGTKLVFTGDIHQIDSPYLDIHSNGLTHLGEKLYGQEIFCHINLTKGERSQLSELAGKLL
ncbi:MAG: phosphate starvation-inducible protein PhoH [Bacteroidetes bacterium GWE2_39_28]|nr:MAG: phosphate starvation-inducible protein PhoH [Bacteroidetes bacterium GWE2_39_28]OFY15543.1 MAG: phosphate starvation-inducible protein PhoH [Bacteroidetes bacterium GWF2_39_10]OFZ06973.1 MAG: phosphate starvation-inducible protein PhoH [Bacteroidetes bacterium RIFOXYB2_FULL_39_7]HCT94491.1 ribonuclease [Rikenellaceae bacterium]HCV14779.1 ribonuclease [Rikenellaceae bacterium]